MMRGWATHGMARVAALAGMKGRCARWRGAGGGLRCLVLNIARGTH